MKIGMIGLGNMGAPMAERLLAKFGTILVFNRTLSKCDPFVEKGAVKVQSASEMAEKTDVIVLSLPDPRAVSSVMTEILSCGHVGLAIIDTSTVSPALSQEMAKASAQKGIYYVDCPVSGGPAGTLKGSLSIMIGAEEAEFTEKGLKDVTDAFCSKYFFMKERGRGNAIKLINNFMAFAAQAVNGEALSMADALGISAEDFYAVTTASSGNNMILNAKKNKVLNDDLKPGFATDLVIKDLELADDLCHDEHVPAFMLNNALQFYRQASAKGYGKADSSSVIKVIRENSKKA